MKLTTLLKSWKYRIGYDLGSFFFHYFPIYINSLNVFKLFKEWWQGRDIFMAPAIIKVEDDSDISHVDKYYNEKIKRKILYIELIELGWKSKFTDYTVYAPPSIRIKLFNKQWRWDIREPHYDCGEPPYDDCSLYYEAILNHIYGDWHLSTKTVTYPDIYELYKNNIWTRYGDDNKSQTFTIRPYLKHFSFIKLERMISNSIKDR